MTLGSLFDGIGGFPLAGVMCGIRPVWASEIEPFPMKVTAARFPEMKQLGSVTEIDGAEAEPVDIITFGSPCQDLSIAGKQLGIHDGERSNLFFEAIRIIKEMRHADELRGRSGRDVRPRFAVWENVPGAFSSNGGEDFRAVLEAFASVREDGVSIPRPPVWETGGGILGNGWSLAWRVYDAQYWGVPQRRRRIYLVADFAGERAGEILFEREGLRGNPAAGGTAGEGTAEDAERSPGRSSGVRCMNPRDVQSKHIMTQDSTSEALCAGEKRWAGLPPNVCYPNDGVKCLNPWDTQSIRQYDVSGVAPNLNANNRGGQNRWGVCYPCGGGVAGFKGRQGVKAGNIGYSIGVAPTLIAGQETHTVYALQGNGIDRADTARCNGAGWRENEMYTLDTIDRPAIAFQQNQRDEVRSMGEQAGAITAQPGVHNQNYICYPETARSLCARHDSSPCDDRGQNVVAIDCRNMCGNDEVSGTLQAKNEGGYSLNYVNPICYAQDAYDAYPEGCATLKATGGSHGGGSESLVVEHL